MPTHDKTVEELLRVMRGIALSTRSRAGMREHLAAYADFHPIRNGVATYSGWQGVLPSFLHTPDLLMARRAYVLAPLMVMLLLGGGTAYAAEYTVPGETLYPVKVAVNERVRGMFALSEEAQARWQAHLVERRVSEVERLAATQSLDATTETVLGEQIALHVENALARTKVLDASGKSDTAAAIRTDMEASLRARAEILITLRTRRKKDVGEGVVAETEPLKRFISALHARSTAVADAAEAARDERPSDERTEADAALGAAERAVTAAEEALQRMGEEHAGGLGARLGVRLARARDILAAARAAFEQAQYAEARDHALQATLEAKKIGVFTTGTSLIREDAGFSDLIPRERLDDARTDREHLNNRAHERLETRQRLKKNRTDHDRLDSGRNGKDASR